MKIEKLELKDFTVLDSYNKFLFTTNMNIFLGENSTGKTQILKAIYSVISSVEILKGNNTFDYKKQKTTELFNKIFGVDKIGSLSNFESKEESKIQLKFSELHIQLNYEFNSKKKYIETDVINENNNKITDKLNVIYLPVKEMLSNTNDYRAYYEERKIDNDLIYYDLSKKLLLPELKELNNFAKEVIGLIEEEIGYKIIFENNKFYFKYSNKKLEIDLLAEGYKKLALILILLKNGSINENTILLWDEPEVNMNPKFMSLIFKVLEILAQNGVQIIMATHSYFLCQEIDLYSLDNRIENKIETKFFSLYKENNRINCETNSICQDLENNKIYEQFESLFQRGVEIE